ncbi:MAG: 2-C-methyl-D-erythritol 4-phosphate cytidylyltransferase [candidate division WS1 bacterium]|jgi:2-C-methyl-D-erythritol 4-phosphate cytidylyltransferase/2-C-methyl-D-erythritol 2,4-cyclodiphosphate synthase|nr:2-C-methyl-D-erythritol 4-phosphate cytidylyltransferase [candidate division WS1 bacterium]
MRAAGLIMAAGRGKRMGAALPKCFLPLAGAPLYAYSLRALAAVPEIGVAVLVIPPDCSRQVEEHLEGMELPWPVQVTIGGENRDDSVRAGLEALRTTSPEIVAIQDGARPFVTPQLITDTLRAAEKYAAAVAAVPLADTLKRAGEDLMISETVDRTSLWRAQTPQTFRYELIVQAHQRAEKENWPATDDAMLVERLGHKVQLVPAGEGNMKVTTPEDLERAERLLASRGTMRIGQGYDLHRLERGRPLILGGVKILHDRGPVGHSDGDLVCHALGDALLGAAALGDVGVHFPDTDPAYAGADSAVLLSQVAEKVRTAGYRIVNCDLTVITEAPKLQPHVAAMRARLAEALGITPEQVSIKAKTDEGVGAIGQGQALACHAATLLEACA